MVLAGFLVVYVDVRSSRPVSNLFSVSRNRCTLHHKADGRNLDRRLLRLLQSADDYLNPAAL